MLSFFLGWTIKYLMIIKFNTRLFITQSRKTDRLIPVQKSLASKMDCPNAFFPTSLVILIGERAQSTNSFFFLYVASSFYITLAMHTMLFLCYFFTLHQHSARKKNSSWWSSLSFHQPENNRRRVFHLLFDSFVLLCVDLLPFVLL